MNGPIEERPLNRSETSVLVGMVALNLTLGGIFFMRTGLKAYLAIFFLMSFGWTYGCFLGLKRGFMLGAGLVIRREENPFRFYLNIAVLIGMYLIMLLVFVGMFLQEIGYLARQR